jgi:Tat protein translocase TatB subunit
MPSSLGPAEILVVLVVALIVLGPSRLPEAGRQVGKALSELRRWTTDLKSEMNKAFEEETVQRSPTPLATPAPEAIPPVDTRPVDTGPVDTGPPVASPTASAPTAPIETFLAGPPPPAQEPPSALSEAPPITEPQPVAATEPPALAPTQELPAPPADASDSASSQPPEAR